MNIALWRFKERFLPHYSKGIRTCENLKRKETDSILIFVYMNLGLWKLKYSEGQIAFVVLKLYIKPHLSIL